MHPPSDKGSALLITLFFITIITVVAVGFMSSVRVERDSSHSHFERMRAGEFARAGIEQTVGTLRRETAYRYKAPDPDPTQPARYYYRNYITQPGALIVPDAPTGTAADSGTQARLKQVVLLSSGLPTVTQTDPILEPPNLNIQTFDSATQPTHLITDRQEIDPATNQPKVSEMKLKWIYVRQNRKAHPNDPSTWTEEIDLSEKPILTDATRPIIGRYAYWADDESTKINYNLAWRRDTATGINPNRPCHPSRINLMALMLANQTPLTDQMADSLHNWTTTTPGRYFNSFADARQVDPAISQFLDYNKFELTHYNHDPDTTFFGEDRILLTTNRDLVPHVTDPVTKQVKYTRKFLDIMRDDKPAASLDPGVYEDIAGGQQDWRADASGNTLVQGGVNKYDLTVRELIRYISEKNWPLSPGVSFKDKYYKGSLDTEARIAQIAVSIIDYVRAKESPQELVGPVRFALDGSGKYSLHATIAYGTANSFQGVGRAPYVTEMGFYIAKNPESIMVPSGSTYVAKNCYKCTFKMELHLPARYDLPDGIELVPPQMKVRPLTAGIQNGFFLRYTATSSQDANHVFYHLSPITNKMVNIHTHATYAVPILDGDVTGSDGTVLKPGKYVTVTKIFYREKAWSDPASGTKALMRGSIHRATMGADGLMLAPLNRWPRLNVCPQTGSVTYTIADPDKSSPDNFPSIETDDPRANVAVADWMPNKNATAFLTNPALTANTFGKENSVSTLGKMAPTAPAAAPADPLPQQDTDALGQLTNYGAYMPPPKGKGSNGPTGDNGLVTSIGELGYINTGMDAKTKSTSWRTIRLQPNYFKDSTVLPDWALMDLFAVPNTTAPTASLYTPHNTSVGGRVNVNSHVEPFKNMVRDGALLASVLGAKGLKVPTDASKVAANIYQRVLATGTNAGKSYGYPNKANPLPTDPNAYDTPGEVCEIKGVADTGEQSEDLVRDIASLLTARGGVFSVYTVGQSLQQTPAGKLMVTGEQRQHAIVERYLENQGTLTTDDDEVHFRTVYFRNLNP